MDGNAYTPDGWAQIGRIADLETLTCRSNGITDEHLAGLRPLTNLKDLQLIGQSGTASPLTARGLESLADATRLRRLVLHSKGINDRACELIGSHGSLRWLDVRGAVTDRGLRSFSQLRELRHLVIQGEFTDAGLSHLAGLKHLEVLVLISGRLKGTGLRHLSDLSELRTLRFSGSPDGDATLASLSRWPALTTLNLASSATDDALLRTLGDLPRLEALALEGASITDEGLAVVAGLTNLRELDLHNTAITSRGLGRLQTLQKLRVLAVGHYARLKLITDLSPLSRLSNLEELDMTHVEVVDLELEPLVRLKSLAKVVLNIENPDRAQRWRQARPDVDRNSEVIVPSRRVGRFGLQTDEIP